METTQDDMVEAGGEALPSGWVRTTLEEIYEIVGGGTPSTQVESYWQGEIPWITSADIYDLKDVRPRNLLLLKRLKTQPQIMYQREASLW